MNEFLIEKLKGTYDDDTISVILDGLSIDRKTSFRVNLLRSNIEEIKSILDSLNINYSQFESISNIFILESGSESLIQNLDIYKDGKIYLQSISSILPAYLLESKENENILDMCAAPGGKTTLISMISNNKVNLTAVELHKDRFERLKYNLKIQGANAYTLNINSIDLDDNLRFDKILLDAPCTGSGVLNINDDKYKKYFTNELIEKCVKTQKRLITKARKILKSAGILVYSTCSLLKEENEEMIDFALKNGFKIDKEGIKDFVKNTFKTSLDSEIKLDDKFIKIFPSEIYEGFFTTRFIKT